MADITSIQLPTQFSTQGASQTDAKKLQSYLYQLTEQLRYVLANLDEENMSGTYNNATQTAVAQVTELSQTQKQQFEELKQGIVATATKIAHEYQSAISVANDALKTEVEEQYVAENESLQAELTQLLHSELTQTSDSLNVTLHNVANMTQQTADALETLSSNTATWFRFTEAGLELGKSENGETVPYTMQIDNEKLSFLHYGNVVAYLRYNRLYVSAAEVSDRISIGGSAGEGYYDFVTTATGLGVKWRAN